MGTGLASWAFAAALVVTAPALAAPKCLANGTSFEVGQAGCLTLSGKSHLARCDLVLNNTSWTKTQDGCSHAEPAKNLAAKPASQPAQPSATPNEPTEN